MYIRLGIFMFPHYTNALELVLVLIVFAMAQVRRCGI